MRKLLPVIGLVLLLTWDRWWPTVYRATGASFWTVLLFVGAVAGVWRWVAFFLDRRRAPPRENAP